MRTPIRIGGRLEMWYAQRTQAAVHRQLLAVALAVETPADRLRALRLFAKLRQNDVRRVLATTPDRISHMERGRRPPTDADYARLAELYAVPLEALYDGRVSETIT